MFDYIRDPHQIETESFRQIRALTDLSRFNDDEQQVAMRLVHTCGEPDVVKDFRLTEHAVSNGKQALENQAPVLCDVEMVRHGLTRRFLQSKTHCFLSDPQAVALAKQKNQTRSMAAVDSWRPYLQDSVCLIGNAPTALFRLLEIIETEQRKPALIIGMPVGFVGAAESKQALWQKAEQLQLQCMTVLGRRGGSALTASALNALLRLINGVRF